MKIFAVQQIRLFILDTNFTVTESHVSEDLTPWRRVLLEKLVLSASQEIPDMFWNPKVTMFTRLRHRFLPGVR
jgi:hypothetical protein